MHLSRVLVIIPSNTTVAWSINDNNCKKNLVCTYEIKLTNEFEQRFRDSTNVRSEHEDG